MLLINNYTNIINEISFYRVGLIIKYTINIITTVLPLIIIIMSSIDIAKAIINPDSFKDDIKIAVNRIIAGLIVFLIPSIINYTFTLIENFDNSSITKYISNASIETIKELEEQYKIEKQEAEALKKAEDKELILERLEQEQKRNEQLEKLPDVNSGSDNEGAYNGDTTSNGTYGSLKVENGVFYIPNQRATSDNDIPKQSGQYGLNPIFWERLNSLINDAAARGYKIGVTSGWRSYSSQKNLWDNSTRPCSERNNWTACPGGSRHGFGIAADLSFDGSSCSGSWDCNSAAKWAHDNAANYGLTFRLSWEAWHIEPINVQGGSFGTCTATC